MNSYFVYLGSQVSNWCWEYCEGFGWT